MVDQPPPCSLPDTQSQKELDWSQQENTQSPVWGRLYPVRIYLKTLDMTKPSFTIGRATECDLVLNGQNLSPNILRIVSKKHFTITRQQNDEVSTICLEDSSYNGTYVNGKLIGRGNKILLQTDDEIAIGHQSLKIYVFKCLIEDCYGGLPKAITNKYVVSKLLGTGACGKVNLVWNKVTFEKFAMKQVIKNKHDKATLQDDPARIQNEVEILKSLNHPNIIHMEDILDTDDTMYMILELMQGGDLFSRILNSDYGLPELESKVIFYQIALAVKYLHDHDITHRDIKPENILLNTNETFTLVKVTDFGLSKIIETNVEMKTVCGTPLYLAPEILLTRGKSTYTKQIDVWSLGVLLYALLSGASPFSEDDPNLSLSDQITKGIYSFPRICFKKISSDAIDLVKRMLVVDPVKRITSEAILKHNWFNDGLMKTKVQNLYSKSKASEPIQVLARVDFNMADTERGLVEPNQKRIRLC